MSSAQSIAPATDTVDMDDPGRRPPKGRWLVPLLALIVVVAVILTLARVVDPVPAFVGAMLASLLLGAVGVVVNRPAAVRSDRLGPRTIIGVALWVVAIGAFVALAAAWSDFGTP